MPIFNAKQKAKEQAKELAAQYNLQYNPGEETFSIYGKMDSSKTKQGTDLMVDADRVLPTLSRKKRLTTKYFELAAQKEFLDKKQKEYESQKAIDDKEKSETEKAPTEENKYIKELTDKIVTLENKINTMFSDKTATGPSNETETVVSDEVPTNEIAYKVSADRQAKLSAGSKEIATEFTKIDNSVKDQINKVYQKDMKTTYSTPGSMPTRLVLRGPAEFEIRKIKADAEVKKNALRTSIWKKYFPEGLVDKNSIDFNKFALPNTEINLLPPTLGTSSILAPKFGGSNINLTK